VGGAQAGMPATGDGPVLLEGEDNLCGSGLFDDGDAVRDELVAAIDRVGCGEGLAVG
jgi:hypothetical protein